VYDSKQVKFLEEQGFIFGSLFLLANKLQVSSDKHLESVGLTTKQWFLIAAVQNFKTPPTLSEVSELIGSSRQNVKQLAIKLEKKNFLTLEKDEQAVRLILTEQCINIWRDRDALDKQFITEILSCLTIDQYNFLGSHLSRLFYLNMLFLYMVYIPILTNLQAKTRYCTVSADLYFNEKGGLVNSVCGYIYCLEEDSSYKKVKWSTPLKDYRYINGLLLASRVEAVWNYPQGDDCYIKLTNIKGLKYNCDSF
jgi:DNA-binding MarR family transcriptional regulator